MREPTPEDGHLRIGELSRRTGVTPELLRAWEDRYRLLAPTRTSGGFRLYRDTDEQRVRLMRRHLAAGVAAAEAARLALADEDPPPPRDSPVPPATADDALRRALDAFDDEAAHLALDHAFSAYGLEITLRDVVVPYLRELGERWVQGSASIAQEHFSSALLRGRLLGVSRGWGGGSGPLALLACVPGDQHDLGLICFGLALRGHGWRIAYLGPDTPITTALDAIERMHPAIVVLTASSDDLLDHSIDGIGRLAAAVPVWLAGRGASESRASSAGANHLPGDPVSAAAWVASAPSGRMS